MDITIWGTLALSYIISFLLGVTVTLAFHDKGD